MPSITWDNSFEALPADVDEAKYGATKIRQLKLAISERLELEMNFKTGTQPLLKAGKAAAIFIGTTAEITALTGMATGAFAWDTTLKVLKYYSGAAWTILDIDHGAGSGLTDDDHVGYLKLTKVGQEITENLAVTALKTIDGRDLSVDGAKLDTLSGGLKFLATPVNKVDWAAATDWTDVDISANTGTDTAKAALLAVELVFNSTLVAPYNKQRMSGWFRKNGSSEEVVLSKIMVTGMFYAAGSLHPSGAGMYIVELDGSEVFETKLTLDSGGTSTISYKVNLIGYFI